MTGDICRYVRVTITVTSHPGSKSNRDKINRQLITQMLFQLFIQLAQVVRHTFPQAVFNYRETPFGFINRAWAQLADLIRMPGLGNELTQTAHQLVAFIIDEVFVIKLLEAGVHFTHFMDQRTTSDLGRVGGEYQLQRE